MHYLCRRFRKPNLKNFITMSKRTDNDPQGEKPNWFGIILKIVLYAAGLIGGAYGLHIAAAALR